MREVRSWSADELRAFLDFTADTPLGLVWRLAAATGLRRGEFLGLRWCDVDLDRRTITVRRALTVVDGVARLKRPKTSRTRTLTIDRVTAEALAAHRQAAAVHAGDPEWDLVFTEDGRHVDPMRVTLEFRRAVRASGLPTLHLHSLRHTHASLLLAKGVPIKVVSERLGHATVALTLDIYAHVLPAQDGAAADVFGELLDPDDP